MGNSKRSPWRMSMSLPACGWASLHRVTMKQKKKLYFFFPTQIFLFPTNNMLFFYLSLAVWCEGGVRVNYTISPPLFFLSSKGWTVSQKNAADAESYMNTLRPGRERVPLWWISNIVFWWIHLDLKLWAGFLSSSVLLHTYNRLLHFLDLQVCTAVIIHHNSFR